MVVGEKGRGMKPFQSASLICVPIAIAFLLLGTVACNHTTSNNPRKAPDFILKDLSGRDVSLVGFEGRVILVDFWATWCAPCRHSIPELVSLQERYGEQGLVIIGISLDDPAKVDDQVLVAFKKQNRINYPIVRGPGIPGVVEDYFGDEKLRIPTIFIVDRRGIIVDRHSGFIPGALEKFLQGFF